jgi:transcriptional regulator with XRE-family HTH domain
MKTSAVATVAKEMKKMRVDLEMRIQDLAENTGFSSAYLSSVETGARPMSPDFLNTLQRYVSWMIENLGDDRMREETEKRLQIIEDAAFLTATEVKIRTDDVERQKAAYNFARLINMLPQEKLEGANRIISTYLGRHITTCSEPQHNTIRVHNHNARKRRYMADQEAKAQLTCKKEAAVA